MYKLQTQKQRQIDKDVKSSDERGLGTDTNKTLNESGTEYNGNCEAVGLEGQTKGFNHRMVVDHQIRCFKVSKWFIWFPDS